MALDPRLRLLVQTDRSTTDRPDEVIGPQVHWLYAVPADSASWDRGFDVDGTASAMAAVIQGFIQAQTGLTIRMDTAGGALDVTYLPLPQTGGQLLAQGAGLYGVLAQDVKAAGFDAPGKDYALLYDGPAGSGYCGQGAPGLAVGYLHGTPAGTPTCDSIPPPAPGSGFSGTIDYTSAEFAHELFHSFGLVAPCAPHYMQSNPGHVPEPDDLMYGGGSGYWQVGSLTVDVGHDDYFGEHTPPNCPKFDTSDYASNAVFGRVTVSIQGDGGAELLLPGGGLLDCQPEAPCSTDLRAGGVVSVSPLPATGSHFVGFDGCSGGCRVAVPADAEAKVSLRFAPDPWLTIKLTGGGRGSVTIPTGGSCSRTVCRTQIPYRQRMAFTVSPNSRSVFTGWGGVCRGRGICRLSLTHDATLIAHFARMPLCRSGQRSTALKPCRKRS